ncbi:MAG: hypothetical protein JOY70_07060 [Acidisphaera sp.]|nr:hypothetical protein [Acidisphaera sp.]MBV9812589.1 hypothetical protein [Acetobacteraceae bacterium]
MRRLALALALAASAATPAMAQVVIQAPPGTYYPYPPRNDWHHPGDWNGWNESRRHEYYDQWRQANWRCEHGDRGACAWMNDHR